MIEVIATDESPPSDMSIVFRALAPFLLPLRSDRDPVPIYAGQMLALNQEALDESDALGGALVALISVGAVTLIRDAVVH
jgi:hypothetical protein